MRLGSLNQFKPSSEIFNDRSKVVLLLWIFYVFFCVVFSMPLCELVYMCLVVTLLGKALSFGYRLWCLTVRVSLSHWYPGSGVVLDCIDS